MHLADFSIGILGESGIVASAVPVAVGAALGSKMQGNDRVVIPFFGDGASNQGACHEAMNLASIWNLPVIFLCENNQYAVTTSFKDSVAVENISDRAVAYIAVSRPNELAALDEFLDRFVEVPNGHHSLHHPHQHVFVISRHDRLLTKFGSENASMLVWRIRGFPPVHIIARIDVRRNYSTIRDANSTPA